LAEMNEKALTLISYGLYVIGAKLGEKLNGQIADAVCQVASEPQLLALSSNKKNLTHDMIKESGKFSVVILEKETPLTYIGRFGFRSGREVEKFEGINYFLTERELPIPTDYALAYIECEVVQVVDVGSHTLFIGKIVNADILKEGEPLTYAYYQQVKKWKVSEASPTYHKTS